MERVAIFFMEKFIDSGVLPIFNTFIIVISPKINQLILERKWHSRIEENERKIKNQYVTSDYLERNYLRELDIYRNYVTHDTFNSSINEAMDKINIKLDQIEQLIQLKIDNQDNRISSLEHAKKRTK